MWDLSTMGRYGRWRGTAPGDTVWDGHSVSSGHGPAHRGAIDQGPHPLAIRPLVRTQAFLGLLRKGETGAVQLVRQEDAAASDYVTAMLLVSHSSSRERIEYDFCAHGESSSAAAESRYQPGRLFGQMTLGEKAQATKEGGA